MHTCCTSGQQGINTTQVSDMGGKKLTLKKLPFGKKSRLCRVFYSPFKQMLGGKEQSRVN